MQDHTLPCTVQRITIDGVDLAVKSLRAGPYPEHSSRIPVVCLSAAGHDALDFAPLAQRLGAAFEFICIEWPGHGDSGADHQPASAVRYAELVEGALWQLSLRNPIIIGNSIGGATAIRYAARRPVRGLVLCDSGGLVEVDATVRKACRLFERFFALGQRGAWWYPAVFSLYYRIVLPKPAAAKQRRRIVANGIKLAPLLRQAWASFGQPEADLRDLSASLTHPIWVAWAKHDRVIPLQRCLPAIRALQNATLDTFDAGHSAFLEQPDQFAERFAAFVDGLDRHQPAVTPPIEMCAHA
jgi:4,5:9,10-diseco-3-hydroxy-5,9,17-trioxoandrosta-1(10),2-diene-4-oate hydrolase